MTASLLRVGFSAMLLTVLTMRLQRANASATLELRMNNFQNPTEHDWNGECCDGLCIGQCDNIFRFFLDKADGLANDPKSYYYWSKVTGTYQDTNSNTFSSDMNGLTNPIITPFDSWPGSVLFKVFVEDDDTGFSGNDDIDGMIQQLQLVPSKTKASAVARTITLTGIRPRDKTTLSMDYTLYCNDNYYGPSCFVFCVAQDSDQLGHYTCDLDTGDKLCRPGWQNISTNCLTRSDDCMNSQCLNGARCIDGVRSYTCLCADGYTGRFCDVNINECLSNPCQNGGTCSDLVGGYTCACRNGYVGPTCAETACRQGVNPCRNGGTCYTSGGQMCLCPKGFVGNSCEMKMCEAMPCLNGGTCGGDSTCVCPQGFTGNQCEVQICDMVAMHCQNGGSCINGTCLCPSRYAGVNCEKEACGTNTCANGGICRNTARGYECQCPSTYTGPRCESSLPNTDPDFNAQNSDKDADVTILQGDGGKLLIALIVICIIFFIVIIILVSILLCLRRRARKNPPTPRPIPVSERNSRRLDSVIVTTKTENFYLETEKSGKDDLNGNKSSKRRNNWNHSITANDQPVNGENHYETLDASGAGKHQNTTTEKHDNETADDDRMKELCLCEIKDSNGDTIRLEKKLANC